MPGVAKLNEVLPNVLHLPGQPKVGCPNTLYHPLCLPEVRKVFPAHLGSVYPPNSRAFSGFPASTCLTSLHTNPGRSKRAEKCLGGSGSDSPVTYLMEVLVQSTPRQKGRVTNQPGITCVRSPDRGVSLCPQHAGFVLFAGGGPGPNCCWHKCPGPTRECPMGVGVLGLALVPPCCRGRG